MEDWVGLEVLQSHRVVAVEGIERALGLLGDWLGLEIPRNHRVGGYVRIEWA